MHGTVIYRNSIIIYYIYDIYCIFLLLVTKLKPIYRYRIGSKERISPKILFKLFEVVFSSSVVGNTLRGINCEPFLLLIFNLILILSFMLSASLRQAE